MKRYGRTKRPIVESTHLVAIFCAAAFLAALLASRKAPPSTGHAYDDARNTCDASVDWNAEKKDPSLGMAAVFTPYNIVFGGGERYLLSVVAVMQREGYFVDVLVESQNTCNSTTRLMEVANGLRVAVDSSRVALKIVEKNHQERRLRVRENLYSVFVSMGNEKSPLARGVGHVNLYMCQFPFDLDRPIEDVDVESLSSYDSVLVNSRFSAKYYDFFASGLMMRSIREFGSAPQVEILHPPVSPFGGGTDPASRKDIVLLGRFFEGRQSKGHGAAIDVFRSIRKELPSDTRLRFVGKLMENHGPYLDGLKKRSIGLPVIFDVDAPTSSVADALRTSLVQWHMTGGDADTTADPASEEHFGISVVEGQSAGAIPVVLDRGGLGDIIDDGKNGFLEKDAREIGERTVRIFAYSKEKKRSTSEEAVRGSSRFSDESFGASLSRIIRRGHLSKPFRHLISSTRGEVFSRRFSVPHPKISKKALVIVEPRQHYAFEYAIKNALYHIGGWGLYVFHGIDNEDFVKVALKDVRGVVFKRLDAHSMTTSDLNKILLNEEFWNEIEADKALLFQTDSLFVRGDIERFERFDYIGAPWARDNERLRPVGTLVPSGVGNGGLSLRNVRKMRDIAKRLGDRASGEEQEDFVYSIALGFDDSAILPSRTEARDFAAEVPISEMEDERSKMGATGYPMAIHAAWYYWSYDETMMHRLRDILEFSVCGA